VGKDKQNESSDAQASRLLDSYNRIFSKDAPPRMGFAWALHGLKSWSWLQSTSGPGEKSQAVPDARE